MLRTHAAPPARRPGVILLVVVIMLALFAVVGLTFVLYAESEAVTARAYKEAESPRKADAEPELLLSYFLSQLLYDVPEGHTGLDSVNSAMRGHSLTRSMAGYNYQSMDTNTMFFEGVGRLHTAAKGAPFGGDEYNFINYMRFPSDGVVHYPERYGWGPATLSPSNPRFNNIFTYASGADVPYTYPDLNNMFLAAMRPADGAILIQSFHRPWLFGKLTDQGNPNWHSPQGKYMILRPRPDDNARDPVTKQPLFPYPEDEGGDVKNFVGGAGYFDGQSMHNNDSVWMDLGYPVRVGPDGKRFKPLFAPLVLDLDNRINLSVHGNTLGMPANTPPNAPATFNSHRSNQGWGPWEINASQVASVPDPMSQQKMAEIQTFIKNTRTLAGAPALTSPRFFSQCDFDARVAGTNSPSGKIQLPTGMECFPSFGGGYENFKASETSPAHPASLNVYAQVGNLGPLSNLEALLRYGETNSPALTSSLYQSLPRTLSDPRIRRLLTTLSVDIDTPSTSPWIWDRSKSQLTMADTDPFPKANGTIKFPTDAGLAPGKPFPASPGVIPPEFNAEWRGNLGRVFGTNNAADLNSPPVVPFANPDMQNLDNVFRNSGLEYGKINLNTPLRPIVNSPDGTPTIDQANNPLAWPAPPRLKFNPLNPNPPPNDPNDTLAPSDQSKQGQQSVADFLPVSNANAFPIALHHAAVSSRQVLARAILFRLCAVTNTPSPMDYWGNFNDAAPDPIADPAGYNAMRYLAQLAVNIVDYIDEDDAMTPFCWYPKKTTDYLYNSDPNVAIRYCYVFGTEIPRLLLNECFIESKKGKDPNNSKQQVMHYEIGVKLYNAFRDDPVRGNAFPLVQPGVKWYDRDEPDDPNAGSKKNPNNQQETYTPNHWRLKTGYAVYRVVPVNSAFDPRKATTDARDPNTGIPCRSNPCGVPDGKNDNPRQWQAGSMYYMRLPEKEPKSGGVAPPQRTAMCEVWDAAPGPQQYYWVSSSAPHTYYTTANPAFSNMTFPAGDNMNSTTPPNGTGKPNFAVKAPDYLDATDNNKPIATATLTIQDNNVKNTIPDMTILLQRLANPLMPPDSDPRSPSFNPYITVDFMDHVTVNPQGGTTSKARAQFYVASTDQTQPSLHFSSDNKVMTDLRNKGVNMPWLTHMDRKLTSPTEILQVSDVGPVDLTHSFMNEKLAQAKGASIIQAHVAPWLSEKTRLYRALEFLSVNRWTVNTISGWAPGSPVLGGPVGTISQLQLRSVDGGKDLDGLGKGGMSQTDQLLQGNGTWSVRLSPGNYMSMGNATNSSGFFAFGRKGALIDVDGEIGQIQDIAGRFGGFGMATNSISIQLKHPPAVPDLVQGYSTGYQHYRLLSLVERMPGRININTLFPDYYTPQGQPVSTVFRALCDAAAPNQFTSQQIDNLFAALYRSRTPGGVPMAHLPNSNTPVDRPFLPPSTGVIPAGTQYPRGAGIEDTIFRSAGGKFPLLANPSFMNLQSEKIADGQPAATHPYFEQSLLHKIYPHITYKSNVFAVWITVGFFEVDDSGLLGREIGRAEGRHVRHRMFSIVDRSDAMNVSKSGKNVNYAMLSQLGKGVTPGKSVPIYLADMSNVYYGGTVTLTNPASTESVRVTGINPPNSVTLSGFKNMYDKGASVQFTAQVPQMKNGQPVLDPNTGLPVTQPQNFGGTTTSPIQGGSSTVQLSDPSLLQNLRPGSQMTVHSDPYQEDIHVDDVYPREGLPQYFIGSPTKTFNTGASSKSPINIWMGDPQNPGPQRTFNARELLFFSGLGIPYYTIID